MSQETVEPVIKFKIGDQQHEITVVPYDDDFRARLRRAEKAEGIVRLRDRFGDGDLAVGDLAIRLLASSWTCNGERVVDADRKEILKAYDKLQVRILAVANALNEQAQKDLIFEEGKS